MKKIIAMLACLTLVLTMFAGLTVSAANYGTPTFKAEFVGFVDATGAAWTETSAEPKFALVKFSYSGFENFSAYDDGSADYTYLESVTGIASIGFQTAIDNTTTHMLVGTQNKPANIFFNYGTYNAGQKKFGGMAGTFADYVTATSGDICQYVIKVNDHEATNAVTIPSVEFSVKSIVAGSEVASVVYKTADVTLDLASAVIPKSAADVATEFDVTVNADSKAIVGTYADKTTGTVEFTATPAFGYKLNVTADKGDVTFDPAGGTVKVENIDANVTITVAVENVDTAVVATSYVDDSKAYIFGKANFAASAYGVAVKINGAVVNDPANGVADGKYAFDKTAVNGAFGVAFDVTGKVFKGDWSVKAYADELESAAVTFAIN